MATAEDALNLARAQLGKGPDEFCAWYPAPIGTAWCCIFQSWVLTYSGTQDTHYAWVSGLFDAMRAQGRTFAPREAQPGDLVAFDYDGGGRSNYDHIAMVEAVTADGIVAINGNWQNRVQRVLHRWDRGGFAGGIAEIARPFYTAPQPEDDEVKQTIMWDKRGAAWHCCGNTRVALTSPAQVDVLKFFGVPEVGSAGPGGVEDVVLETMAIVPRNGGTFTPGR